MYNIFKKHRRWRLMTAILSLSLLTVMAGAAVAPALNIIQTHFHTASPGLVQMIISIPAIFIAIANLFFKRLCRCFTIRTLVIIGLVLYTAGGCLAGAFDNIYAVLIFRAIVGIGVGIIMPMSTGLIAFFFTRDKHSVLMGYSSALNMLGGVIATLIAGALAMVSWRLSFLVYLLGFAALIPCVLWMPREFIKDENKTENLAFGRTAFVPYIICMFLLMLTFFIYPSNFAIETMRTGLFSQTAIGPIMAMMDLMGFAGGLLFSKIKSAAKTCGWLIAPSAFLISYSLLLFTACRPGILLGSAMIGFANGVGVPYIISKATAKAGKSAATTVMPLLSMALYLAQFFTPMITTAVHTLIGNTELSSYYVALGSSLLLLLCSSRIRH